MKKSIIVYHSSGVKGPVDFFEDYLCLENYEVLKISHPLDIYLNESSIITKNKKKILSYGRKNLPLVFNLLTDFIFSIKIALNTEFTYYIGANNFDVLPGLFIKYILRKKIKKIIYFASDYSEKRFASPIMNLIYNNVETVVLKYSDLVISNTKRAEKARIKRNLNKRKSLVVPNGVYLENPTFNKKDVNKNNFIYIGNVTREHGLFTFLKKTNSLIKNLVIIGQGDEIDKINEFCKEKKIKLTVIYRKPHSFVKKYLQSFKGFGLAPYTLDSEWTYYCSPLKINEYVAFGIPVIVSNVPEIADVIKKEKLGIVYESHDLQNLKKKIVAFDTKNYEQKAKQFYERFNYNSLYKHINLN